MCHIESREEQVWLEHLDREEDTIDFSAAWSILWAS